MSKKFNFSKLNAPKTEKEATAAAPERAVRVSAKTLAQVEKVGGEKGLAQAAIIISGPAIPAGPVSLKVDGETYNLQKGKGNTFWPSAQGDCLESFQKLFNKLAAKPDTEMAYEL